MPEPDENCGSADKKIPSSRTPLRHVLNWLEREKLISEYSETVFVLVTIGTHGAEHHIGTNLWQRSPVDTQQEDDLWDALKQCLVTNYQHHEVGHCLTFSQYGRDIATVATNFLVQREITGVLAGCVGRTTRFSCQGMDVQYAHVKTPFIAISPGLSHGRVSKAIRYALVVAKNRGGKRITTADAGEIILIPWEDVDILYAN